MCAIMGVGDTMDEPLLARIDRLIESLKRDANYQETIRLDQEIAENKALSSDLTELQDAQKAYQDMRQYGTHHPDRVTITTRYQTIKTRVFSHPLIKARLKTAQAFQLELDKVSKQLAETISPSVPYQTTFRLHAKGGTSCSNEKV